MALSKEQLATRFNIPPERLNAGDVANLNNIIDAGGDPTGYIRNAVGGTGLGANYNLPAGARNPSPPAPNDRNNNPPPAEPTRENPAYPIPTPPTPPRSRSPRSDAAAATGTNAWGQLDARRQQMIRNLERQQGIKFTNEQLNQLAAAASPNSQVDIIAMAERFVQTQKDAAGQQPTPEAPTPTAPTPEAPSPPAQPTPETPSGPLTAAQIAERYNVPVASVNSGDVDNINELLRTGGNVQYYIDNSLNWAGRGAPPGQPAPTPQAPTPPQAPAPETPAPTPPPWTDLDAAGWAARLGVRADQMNSGDVANLNAIARRDGGEADTISDYVRSSLGGTGIANWQPGQTPAPQAPTPPQAPAPETPAPTPPPWTDLDAAGWAARLGIDVARLNPGDVANLNEIARREGGDSAAIGTYVTDSVGEAPAPQTPAPQTPAPQTPAPTGQVPPWTDLDAAGWATRLGVTAEQLNPGDIANLNNIARTSGLDSDAFRAYMTGSVGGTGISDWTMPAAGTPPPGTPDPTTPDPTDPDPEEEDELDPNSMRGMFSDIFGDQGDQMYRMWMINNMFGGGGGGGGGGFGGFNPYAMGMGQAQPYGQNTGYGQGFNQQNPNAQQTPYQGHFGNIRY